jgi:hypothetical protein
LLDVLDSIFVENARRKGAPALRSLAFVSAVQIEENSCRAFYSNSVNIREQAAIETVGPGMRKRAMACGAGTLAGLTFPPGWCQELLRLERNIVDACVR